MRGTGIWIEKIGAKLYFSRQIGSRRKRKLIGPDTPEVRAAAEVKLAEARRQIAADRMLGIDGRVHVPTFREMAQRYLREDTSRLADTTRGDLEHYLGERSPLIQGFGSVRLHEITVAMLREWWGVNVTPKRSAKTLRRHLVVMQSIFAYAVDLELVATSPVTAFRTILRRHASTKGSRADAVSAARPLEIAEMNALVPAARAEGLEDLVLVLFGLDAGMRLGEAWGVTWGGISFGQAEDDPYRGIYLGETSNRPRGGEATTPKSGRVRQVHLSQRLRAALLELRDQRFRPGPGVRICTKLSQSSWRHAGLRRLLTRAGLGDRAYKDLRDTFASQLLTAGVQLGYISEQLGHADVSVTARHYARWVGGAEYRPPVSLRPGEIPADLLARLEAPGEALQRSHQQAEKR